MVWLILVDVDLFIPKATGSCDKAFPRVSILCQRSLIDGSVKTKSCCSVYRKSIDYFRINNENGKDCSLALRRTAIQNLSIELNSPFPPRFKISLLGIISSPWNQLNHAEALSESSRLPRTKPCRKYTGRLILWGITGWEVGLCDFVYWYKHVGKKMG